MTTKRLIEYNKHKDNCKNCKHWGACGMVEGCTKAFKEKGEGYMVSWPEIAWCEEWEVWEVQHD